MDNRKFHKVLCANRGEIAVRVFRACAELGIRTVAIFSEEDAKHQHRYKADESYLVGAGLKPVDAYLAMDEILDVAEHAHVEAIHPGYGFLSENAEFAQACRDRGIAFIGPRAEVMTALGDKVRARAQAQAAGVPIVPGIEIDLSADDAIARAREFAEGNLPVIVKAAHGGGGRGMRVVQTVDSLAGAIQEAQSEAKAAFGSGEVFLERFLPRVRHIEVQILGDLSGNLVHLFERDCSVQRRHQKVIEIAPAPNLPGPVRERLLADALKLCKAVGYHNAGTVEFLVAGDEHFFIEVNPRLQVEHTVTEAVTGIDLVQSQILVESGFDLPSEEIGIYDQRELETRGYAIQCRVTTEDPSQDFLPDTGTLTAYRSAGGFGVRLDTGNGYPGAHVSPHYDSLLVKVTAFAPTFRGAARKGLRALREFRIRGVKTNVPFLENVLQHDSFLHGETYTRFIDESPELFQLRDYRDRATKVLAYLGEIIVNRHPTITEEQWRQPSTFAEPAVPQVPSTPPPDGTAQILERDGPEGLAKWVKEQTRPLLTDTTMRDAHQSLLATRVRTRDMLRIAPATAHLAHSLFSVETWGGATFDVAYRFLNESPWDRIRKLKRAMPNLLQQMLLRGANAVGYTSYPDNVVETFIDEAAHAGIDVFRVFDSLNDLENMRVSVERVRQTGKIAEVCICYTGDIDNPKRTKYDLAYYSDLAARIEDLGAHFLCIKDMAGLLRPRAARILLEELHKRISLPIHLHTHDTSGNGVATLVNAILSGVDIVDVALAPMAGLTSQPSMNALIAAMRGDPRETKLANKDLQPLADYWEAVREFYEPFECGLKSSTSEVYYHEIPGGQYSNLRPQVASMGLLSRWSEVKDAFAIINKLVGDIPKVTPSSKMVGDFAIFAVQNELLEFVPGDFEASVAKTKAKVLAEASRVDFPQSVVQYFQGHLGEPPGGFPEDLRAAVLKGLPTLQGRPSASMEPFDLDALNDELEDRFSITASPEETISAALYPRVLDDYFSFVQKHGDVSVLDTPTYFYGLEPGREIWVDLEPGKSLVITLDAVSDPDVFGKRTVYFTLNGQARAVSILDRSLGIEPESRRMATADGEVGSPMPGNVIAVHATVGAEVTEGDELLTLEAMKMETIVRAPASGVVKEVAVREKQAVTQGELLVVVG